MTTAETLAHYDSEKKQLLCQGDWDLSHLSHLQTILQQIAWPTSGRLTINGESIERMDTAGAWQLNELQAKLVKLGVSVELQSFPKESQELLTIVQQQDNTPLPDRKPLGALAEIGLFTVTQLKEGKEYLAFVGQLTVELLRILFLPHKWRWSAFANVIYSTGYLGLPIIGLLSFLIGVVLTYQMGLQLKTYGANIYIVDLLGLSVLREFSPLITAIMVAGRTGSAFTAQLGMMKLNQEIDALDTMGVTPGELLLLPRILGLTLVLPLLTVWADIFGVFGGMVMANNMLGISWYDFLHRFPNVIPLKNLLIGVGKAPIFALLIASIGCFQGMLVKGGAESVGRNTTRSVVLSIFFIIVADAAFSVILSKLKL
ncbi:MAG: ABC transporter permease [Gammaproteobacteria bacterium]